MTHLLIPRMVAIALVIVSTAYSVMLWETIATNKIEQWLSIVTAVALQACQFYFLPVGIQKLATKSQRFSGLLFTIIGGFLLIISIGASIGYLERSSLSTDHASLKNSTAYRTYTARIEDLNQQVQILKQAAQSDIDNGFRKRGMKTLNEDIPIKMKEQTLIIKDRADLRSVD